MVRRFAVGFAAATLTCSGLALIAPAAGAATFEVTSGADDGSPGTFRWAVEQVGTDNVVNIAPSVTAISLTDCPSGTVVKGSTGLLTINGNGTTITQTCPEGLFSGTGDVALNDLTLTGGDAVAEPGGAVRISAGNLTLDGVTLTGNHSDESGGAVFVDDHLTIRSSVITDNDADLSGGGASADEVTIVDSVISNNTAGNVGGGVYHDEPDVGMTVTNSTIEGNAAAANAGGLYSEHTIDLVDSKVLANTAQLGAGLYAQTEIVVTGSTVAGNAAVTSGGGMASRVVTVQRSAVNANTAGQAGGGIIVEGSVDVDNSTIADNQATVGGGLAVIGTADISYATIVGNGGSNIASALGATNVFASVIALSDEDCDLSDGGTIVSGGYNVGGDATCGFTGPGDKNAAGDPIISELALNDGTTENSVPLSGSPLLNTVPSSDARCSGTDQRGFARPANGACDTGAVEVRQVSAVSAAFSTPYQTSLITDLVPLVTDPDGVLSEYEVQGVVHGVVDAADGGIVTYTPAAGFSGTDSYTYLVCSTGNVVCAATQTITISVGAAPVVVAAPVAAVPVTVQPTFTG